MSAEDYLAYQDRFGQVWHPPVLTDEEIAAAVRVCERAGCSDLLPMLGVTR